MQSWKDSKTSLDALPSTNQDGLKLVERLIKLSIIGVVFCFWDDKGGYMKQRWFIKGLSRLTNLHQLG